MLAGDYLLARVMVNLSRYGNLRLIQYTAEMISDLLEGEWIQDSLMQDWSVGLHQLDQVHELKTASLFKWCLRAPFLIREQYDPELHQLLSEMGTLLGLLFQRGDDLLDFDVRNQEGKAVLGDLKSGYMNSFAAFLARDMNEKTREEFRSCEDLMAVQVLLGDGEFERQVALFDKLNQDAIDLYLHKAETLDKLIGESAPGISADLKKLPELLYFRRS